MKESPPRSLGVLTRGHSTEERMVVAMSRRPIPQSPDPADEIAHRAFLVSLYCPGCDLERDPLREILTVNWCNEHRPRSDGVDDRRTTLGRDGLSALPEAEAETNRLWCELLHRTLNDAGRAPRPRRRSSAANRRAAERK